MIEERGVVVQNRTNTVLIRAERSSACDSCSAKKSCHGGGSNDMLIEADNPVGARPGDNVVFTVGAGSVVKAGLILYLVPIISFIIGVVLGQTAAKSVFPGYNPDLVSGALGVAFLAAAFIGLKVYSRLIDKNKSYRPQVLRVI